MMNQRNGIEFSGSLDELQKYKGMNINSFRNRARPFYRSLRPSRYRERLFSQEIIDLIENDDLILFQFRPHSPTAWITRTPIFILSKVILLLILQKTRFEIFRVRIKRIIFNFLTRSKDLMSDPAPRLARIVSAVLIDNQALVIDKINKELFLKYSLIWLRENPTLFVEEQVSVLLKHRRSSIFIIFHLRRVTDLQTTEGPMSIRISQE